MGLSSISPFVLLVIAMTLLWSGAKAQSGCSAVLVSMSPCLNYVTRNSSTPSATCCSQLAAVVRSKPECLCRVLDGSADTSLGINIDKSLALALPDACNVKTPPVSLCNATGGPAGSPEGSPTQTSSSVRGAEFMQMALQFAIMALFWSVFKII